jgi:hypothetical protein
MRVPVLIPIGAHVKLPIRYVEQLEANVFGDFCPESLVVRVSKSRHTSSDQLFTTIWHELAHAALWISGWGKALTDEQEEAVVTALEFSIAPYMVFSSKAPGVRWREIQFPWEL